MEKMEKVAKEIVDRYEMELQKVSIQNPMEVNLFVYHKKLFF